MFNANVYCIEFADGYFYIGSTKQKMERRLKSHEHDRMRNLKANKEAGYILRTSFDIYLDKNGWNNPTIRSLEACSVNTLQELKAKEQTHIAVHLNDPKNLNDRNAVTLDGNTMKEPTDIKRIMTVKNLVSMQETHEEGWRTIWIKRILENWDTGRCLYPSHKAISEYQEENPTP